MSAFTVHVDDKAAQAMLARVTQAGTGAKVMQGVALAAKKQVYESFRHAADPWGKPWPPLKPSTIRARRRRDNQSTQPLIDTGKMYASIEATNTATEASVSIGRGLPDARAWYNQFGTGTIRPRAFVPVDTMGAVQPTQAWLDAIMAPIHASLTEAVA